MRWDEEKTHIKPLDIEQSYIWSSATLYPQDIKEKRVSWFESWKNTKPNYERNSILDFHKNAGDGDPLNDIIMNRGGVVQTVSITSIVKANGHIDMQYIDLINDQIKQTKIAVQGEVVEQH